MSVKKCLFDFLKKHCFLSIMLIMIILGVVVLSLIPPLMLKVFVDDVLIGKRGELLIIYALIYTLVYVLIYLVNFFKDVVLVYISSGLSEYIKINMMKHVNRMSYQQFITFEAGSLEAYFSNDVEAINELITKGIVSMGIDLFKIVGIVVSIFLFSYMFGFITLLLVPIIGLFTLLIKRLMFKAQMENRRLEGIVNNQILETVENIRTIQSYRIYDFVQNKYHQFLLKHYKTTLNSNFYDSIFAPIMQTLKMSVIVLIILLATYYQNIFGVSVGVLVSFIDLLNNLFSPIENLGMELQTIQKSLAGIHRVDDFFKIAVDEKKSINQINNQNSDLILKFDDVSFSYNGTEQVLEHFNLIVNKNEAITLSGKSGSGKSTIFKLAYGLIKPTSGSVSVNGVPTYLLGEELKRQLFGIVFQDTFFSNGSIYEEISLNDPSISEKDVLKALKDVGLEYISNIDELLNDQQFSSGELVLFNIARVIVRKNSILFLDEMNAKIDPISAAKILALISEVATDKIIFSINHYGELLENSRIQNVDRNLKTDVL